MTIPRPATDAETAELRRLGAKVRAGERLTEAELDYIAAHHPDYRASFDEADEDLRAGRTVSLDALRAELGE